MLEIKLPRVYVLGIVGHLSAKNAKSAKSAKFSVKRKMANLFLTHLADIATSANFYFGYRLAFLTNLYN